MNKKGFAVTTMVYASVILLAIIIFTVLAIVKDEYGTQKDFVEQVNRNLTSCIDNGGC